MQDLLFDRFEHLVRLRIHKVKHVIMALHFIKRQGFLQCTTQTLDETNDLLYSKWVALRHFVDNDRVSRIKGVFAYALEKMH